MVFSNPNIGFVIFLFKLFHKKNISLKNYTYLKKLSVFLYFLFVDCWINYSNY